VSQPLDEDVEALRVALAGQASELNVALRLPRESAVKVLELLDAERAAGAVVIPIRHEFTTSEAAALLGISRPTLMRLIGSGEIEFTKVGTHHRIPAPALAAFQARRRARQEEAMVALAEFSNEIAFVD